MSIIIIDINNYHILISINHHVHYLVNILSLWGEYCYPHFIIVEEPESKIEAK